jgi:acyl dehydratase
MICLARPARNPKMILSVKEFMPNYIRQRAIEGLKVGDSFKYSRTFTQEETEHFGDITRDYNPVHYDLRWADAKRFNGLICHSLIVESMICEFGGQVGLLATGMNFKFDKPVYFGDTITAKPLGNGVHGTAGTMLPVMSSVGRYHRKPASQ